MATGTCRVCHSTDITVLVEIQRVPVLCNVMWPTRAEAREAPTGDIRLGFCGECGYIFNLAFDPGAVHYTGAYENSLHFSGCFQQYACRLAAELVGKYGLYRKNIVEIGCGQGDFLALLCDLGDNRGYGFDPAYAGGPIGPGPSERITIVRGIFSERHGEYPVDFVCCRHVLEHVDDPKALLTALRRVLGERAAGAPVFFEVPDATATIRELAVWDVIYEHCSYFTPPSLVRVFEESGFEVREVRRLFCGQYLGLEAVPARAGQGGPGTGGGKRGAPEAAAEGELAGLRREVSTFAGRYRDKVGAWASAVWRLGRLGRRTVVWGAGSKGVTFLNALGIRDEIGYVVDVNPRKQGKYIAGTGQKIVPPEFLQEYRPEVVILMNPIYLQECREIADRLGVRPEFICG